MIYLDAAVGPMVKSRLWAVCSLKYPIGGTGCLGASDLAHCLVLDWFSAGLSLNFRWIFVLLICCPCLGFGFPGCVSLLFPLFFLVALPGLWAVIIWFLARNVGLLAMASMIVVMLGRPVCGGWFWWSVSAGAFPYVLGEVLPVCCLLW